MSDGIVVSFGGALIKNRVIKSNPKANKSIFEILFQDI